MLELKGFLGAIDELEAAGIAREVTIQAMKEAFESIFKKKGYEDTKVEVEIIPTAGEINIYTIRTVVDEVEDDALQISLEDARELDPDIQVGEELKEKHELDDFSKTDALKFKSVLRQKIKEAEKAAIYAAYSDKEGELITGVVEKIEDAYTIINIGRTNVVLSNKAKIGDESFQVGQTVKVYLTNVNSLSNGPRLNVTRADGGFLKRLFEEEIPEVFDGTVVIKDVARTAGERSKVSVYSTDPSVDPIGACIGQGGSKIQKICSQLGKEKIDIVQYHEYPGLFIAEALKPAKVVAVKLDEEAHSAIAIVQDDDLRVAIGKRGINVVLAVKLTSWKIDIKEETTAANEGIVGDSLDIMQAKEQALLLEKRRKELLEQNERELAALKARQEAAEAAKAAAQAAAPAAEEEPAAEPAEGPVVPAQEEAIAPSAEEEVIPASKEETPAEEEKPVEEEKVEYNPVQLQPKVTLADLEKQIEDEKKTKVQPQRRKFRKDTEEEKETKDSKAEDKNAPVQPQMAIYTDEELEELDAEEEEENKYDEDVDYSDYDKYYEE